MACLMVQGGADRKQQISNLIHCNGHNNTTKGVTIFNDEYQLVPGTQNNIKQGFTGLLRNV